MSQELCRAAARGNAKKIEQLLAAGANVNWVDAAPDRETVEGWLEGIEHAGFDFIPKTGIGKTPLLFALANGHTAAAKILLDHGADVNIADVLGRSALMFAIERKESGLCKELISRGADVNAIDATRTPVLTWAVQSGSLPLVQLLVEAGADLNPDVPDEQCPVTSAISRDENEELTNWLLDRGARARPQAARKVFLYGWASTLKRLIDAGLDVNAPLADGTLPIDSFKNEATLDLLLKHGVDPRKGGRVMFYRLTQPSAANALRKLVAAGVDINAPFDESGVTYLMHLAAHDGDGTMTRLALELGARVDACDREGNMALDHVNQGPNAINKNKTTIRLLEEHMAALPNPIDLRKRFPFRALVEAAEQGNLQEVCELLDSGVDVNSYSPVHHGTAMIAASRAGRLEIVRELLRRGATPTAPSESPLSLPLTAAATNGHAEIVSLLLELGADVDELSGACYTPLMMAAGKAHLEVCRRLIAAGADLDAQGGRSDTPLSRARDYEWRHEQYNPVVDLLLEAGATNYGGSKLEHEPPRPPCPAAASNEP